jgi:hypothetical protein
VTGGIASGRFLATTVPNLNNTARRKTAEHTEQFRQVALRGIAADEQRHATQC